MTTDDLPPIAIESHPLAIDRVARIEDELKSWASKTVEFSFDATGTDLFSIHELAHSYARRCVDLAASIRSLLEEQREPRDF